MNVQYAIQMGFGVLMLATMGCVTTGVAPQDANGQREQCFEGDIQVAVKLPYLLYLPEDYGKDRKAWPLMLFLHGAGERGDNLDKVKVHGPPKLIEKEDKAFPFIIASPQCPKDGWWASDIQVAALDALLSDLTTRYTVDPDRIYLTGLSMGGYGTWRLAADYPERFAALAPVCGGGDPHKR